jgi:RNA-binding protein
MKLTNEQKRKLKAKAHALKPVIMIGNKGLTEAVQLETERALYSHELIKIRINAEDKKARKEIIDKICQERQAELINTIGHIAVIYRKSED